MKHWLAKNWVGLVGVAVLLPVTLGITFAQQWTAYLANWPTAPVEVDEGVTADYAGTGWSLDSTIRISASSVEGREIGLPNGSDLVVARVLVEPDVLDDDGKSPYCQVRLQELRGQSIAREWNDASFDPIDFDATAGTERYCVTEQTEPYMLESIFIVPEDAGSDGTHLGMSLNVVEELPDYLRITLGQ
jgi:hypothetical protein